MKYFTKEWYELCQKTCAHLLLEESKEAEQFSEEYFQALYQRKLSEYLFSQEEMSKVSFNDIFTAEIDPEFLEGVPKDKVEEIKRVVLEEREQAKENYKQIVYDAEKSTQQFSELLRSNVERAKKVLPEDIFKDIADIRVFALDKATKTTISRVSAFCEKNESIMKKAIKDYSTYYTGIKPKLDNNIIEKMNFHDCKVLNLDIDEEVLSIRLDNSGGFTDVSRVDFEHGKITKQEDSLEGYWWLYDEIYLTREGYEIHVLLQNEKLNLIDFIITTKKIRFVID